MDTSQEQLAEDLAALRTRLSDLENTLQEKDQQLSDLQAKYERYRLVSLAARDAFGDWDIVNDRMWCSQAMRAAFGIGEYIENVYAWFIQSIHPDDRESVKGHMDQLLNSDRVSDETEFRVKIANGDYVHLLFRSFIQRDSDGKPKRMIGLATDNTDHKNLISEWRRSEERYRTIIEDIEDGYHETGLDGKFMFCNQACARNMGRTREEVIGLSSWSTMPDEATARKVRRQYEKVFSTGKAIQRFEHDIVSKDGVRKTLETSISLMTDPKGRPVGFRGTSRDTTERKRAEEELRRYADEISDLYHHAPCGYHSLGPDGTFLRINNTELAWLGYTSEELIGKIKWSDLLTPEGIKIYEKTFPVLKSRGWSDSIELEVIRKDGTRFPVLLNATAVKDSEGRFIMSRSTLFDITERRRMENELHENEQLYWTVLDQSNDGVMMSRNGKYIYANQKFLDTYGRTMDEVIGKQVGTYSHPEDRTEISKATKLVTTGKSVPRYEIRGVKPDGSITYLEVTTIPVIYKGERAGFTYLRDISVRKAAERALKESEEKHRSIIENIEDSYFEVDLAGNYTFVNDATCRIHGRSRHELIGLNNRSYSNPDEARRIYHEFKKMYRTGNSCIISDYEIIRSDSTKGYLELRASVIRNAAGQLVGARGIGRDVTERKLLEDEKKKLTERLNHAQKMQAIGTLAGGIAHDFNNILASIMGFTELAKIRLLQPDLHDYLDQVLNSCARAKDLVNQILTFGRKREKEVQVIDLNPVLHEVSKLLRATLPATIDIKTDAGSNPHTVLADTTEIHQILMNLSANAAYAMRERGGVLKIRMSHMEINNSNSGAFPDLRPGRYVEVSVQDSGEGIDQNTMGQIFDPFFTTKERGKGTGLGLSVVYGISREAGGTVTVKSRPGEGSNFCVYLPAAGSGLEQPVEKPMTIPGGTERILFVDDEEMLAAVGKEMLEHLGYTVVSTHSSLKAFELFRTEPERFDLVITDMTMPSLTGIALSEELMKIRPDIPIILSTGFSDLITEEEAKRAGIREFFMKPFSLGQIARGIRKALQKE